jgi:acyl-CoA reductase-like NAD-dependent aldehyde dehydrogenase
MATAAHRARVEGYIAKGQAEGARLVAGGGRPANLSRGVEGWLREE